MFIALQVRVGYENKVINNLKMRLNKTTFRNRVILRNPMQKVKENGTREVAKCLMPGYIVAEIKEVSTIPAELYYIFKNITNLIKIVNGQISFGEIKHLNNLEHNESIVEYEEPKLEQVINSIEENEKIESQLEDKCQKASRCDNTKSIYNSLMKSLRKVKTKLFYARQYLKKIHLLEKCVVIKGKKLIIALNSNVYEKIKRAKPKTQFYEIKELLTTIMFFYAQKHDFMRNKARKSLSLIAR